MLAKIWAVCDSMNLRVPYMFHDAHAKTPALYFTEEEAKQMFDKLNAASSTRNYVVRRW